MLNRESPTVFIIDDSLLNLQVLRNYLEAIGWEVHTCHEEENAIIAVQSVLPDIILLDILMPKVDGFELCRRLKASPITCQIPIIFISTLEKTADKIKGFNLGAVDYIPKTSHPEEIAARMELHLNITQLQRRLELQNQQLQKITQQQQEAESELRASEQMFSCTFHDHPEPMMILSLTSGKILEANQSFETLIGYSAIDLKGKTDLELSLWENEAQRKSILAKTQQEKFVNEEEVTFLRSKCEKLFILLSTRLIYFLHQEAIVFIPKDITEKRSTEEQLSILFRACEQSPVSIVITNSQGAIEYVNPKFEEVSGYSCQEVSGKSPSVLKSGHTSSEEYCYLWETISTGNCWSGEFHNRKKNGDLYWEKASISPIFSSEGTITHYVAIKEDITLQKEQEQLLYRQANYDSVTGLPNRNLASDRLRQALEIASRNEHKIAVMFIDLDHFKTINDTLGHEMGDKLLRETAQRLQSGLRKVDTVARLGGDEFIIIIANLQTSMQLTVIAKRLLSLLHQPLQLGSQEVFINASIGIAIYPDDGYQANELLRNADTAMYAAKSEGRDTFKFFTPHMNTSAQNRLQLESHLRQAIAKQEISLVYQPIIDLKTGMIVGAESLMRWHNPDLGSISPTQFIPLAEETGLMIELGEWGLQQACQQTAQWLTVCPQIADSFWIAINISPRQIHDDYFLIILMETMENNHLPPRSLCLEVTEQLTLNSKPETNATLSRLNEFQIPIALDDFGTGYSSLNMLRQFHFTFLKIDATFVADLPHQPEAVVLVKTMIAMAKELDLRVIAEGVETEAQRSFLTLQGCDFAQGYLFSYPIQASAFETLVKDQPFNLP